MHGNILLIKYEDLPLKKGMLIKDVAETMIWIEQKAEKNVYDTLINMLRIHNLL